MSAAAYTCTRSRPSEGAGRTAARVPSVQGQPRPRPSLDLGQPPLEKAAFGISGDERQSASVGGRGVGPAAETAEEIGARSRQQVILAEVALGLGGVQEPEARVRPVGHGHGAARSSSTTGDGRTRSSTS